MYSTHHAAISLVVGGVVAAAVAPVSVAGTIVPTVALVGYATALGVLVDLDHFLIARVRTGSWDAVRFCLRNPTAAAFDQGSIFPEGDVGVLSRLLSHLLIIGVLVPATALASPGLGLLTAAVLYAHLLSDVLWDVRNLRRAGLTPVTVPKER